MKIIESVGYKDARTRFLLLAPKIAYTVRRNYEKEPRRDGQKIRMEDSALYQFEQIFLKAYSEVKGTEAEQVAAFSNFVDLMEALLAYHRYNAPEKETDKGKH
ncbi:MAG: type III-A CRISPR-associated protein Csm2 [Bacteroidia bacterium]